MDSKQALYVSLLILQSSEFLLKLKILLQFSIFPSLFIVLFLLLASSIFPFMLIGPDDGPLGKWNFILNESSISASYIFHPLMVTPTFPHEFIITISFITTFFRF